MAIEYTWEILSLYTTPTVGDNSDVIHQVNWRFQATEGNNYADIYRVTDLPAPSGDSFDAYDDLTEDQIISWVKGQIDYDALVEEVNAGLEAQKNPQWEEKAVPWEMTQGLTGEEQYLCVLGDDPNVPNNDEDEDAPKDKNRIGPMGWDSQKLKKAIKKRWDIDVDIFDNIIMYRKNLMPMPGEPLILDAENNIKVYRAEGENLDQPELNSFFQYIGHETYDISTGVAVRQPTTLDFTLDESKERLIDRIEEMFDEKRFKGIDIDYDGETYNTPLQEDYYSYAESRANKMADDDTMWWRFRYKTKELTKTQVSDLATQLSTNLDSLYSWRSNLLGLINGCTTIDELKTAYTNNIVED